jgi:hypothetical protein
MTEELGRVCGLVSELCGKVRGDLRNHQTATSLPQGVMLYWFVKAEKPMMLYFSCGARDIGRMPLPWRELFWRSFFRRNT